MVSKDSNSQQIETSNIQMSKGDNKQQLQSNNPIVGEVGNKTLESLAVYDDYAKTSRNDENTITTSIKLKSLEETP